MKSTEERLHWYYNMPGCKPLHSLIVRDEAIIVRDEAIAYPHPVKKPATDAEIAQAARSFVKNCEVYGLKPSGQNFLAPSGWDELVELVKR
jgi:hypothetical protein